MKLLLQVLTALLVLVSAVTVFLAVRLYTGRAPVYASQVGPDSIAVYERKADSLEQVVASLAARMDSIGLLRRPGLNFKLQRLEGEIAGLRRAIAEWHRTRDSARRNQLYQECLVLYGRASGMCELLLTEDSLP